ncbi:MAG: TonB-dependent receptor [Flavobacteriaceae bacterium]|nr:TonB-dependent receptor [Flavobacteriaceae bacterium]
MNKIKILLYLVFCSHMFYAQNTVTGTIKSSNDSQEIPGVSVMVKGTTFGVATNFDGNYSIKVPKDGVLVYSYMGFKSQEISVNNRVVIDVFLDVDVAALNEVVVVGYGSQRKSDLTGAISTVNMEDVQKRQVSTIDQALQGQMAGVDVTVDSGTPGGSVMVRVRGVGTLNSASPLYVVDGMAVEDIGYLNTSDVKNIQVLKDASSTAIYGSRGANGVVIISTKSGSKNKDAVVSFSSYYGIQNFWRSAPVTDSKHWAILNNEARNAAGFDVEPTLSNPNSLANTNWFNEISNKDAATANYNFSVAGGGEKSTYFVSGGYFNQEGIVNKSNFERVSFRANSAHDVKSWLKVGENITLVKTKKHTILEEDEWTNVLISAMNMSPVTPVRNTDGNYVSGVYNDIWNPVAAIDYTNNLENFYRTLGNVYAELTFLEGLTFKSNLSVEYSFKENDSYTPVYYVALTQQNSVSRISRGHNSQFTNQWSNTLNYKKDIGEHRISVLLGTESFSNKFLWDGASTSDVPTDNPNLQYIDNANGKNSANIYGSALEEKLMSVLSRVNYSYKDKYLLTVNFRADGSSKFSDKHKWGYFPSFSAGWKLSEEDFIKSIDAINSLKLRLGWGKIGNQGSVPAYQFVTTATTGQNYVWGDVLAPGIAFMSSGNDEIKWESSTTTNIGVDFGIFNSKIRGTAEYFVKNTTDMLLQVPVPGQSGLQEAPWQNAGEMKNSGFELSLNYNNSEHKLKYGAGIVFSAIKNEVLSLGVGNAFIDGGLYRDNYYVNRTVVGKPIAQFYGYKTNGLFQNQAEIDAQTAQTNVSPGDVRYVDENNDGNLDYQFLGSPLPDFTYSFNANLEYKGFDFNVVFQGVQGNKIFNGTTYYNRSSTAYWNMNVDMLNRWTGEGSQTNALYPRMNAADSNNSLMSDRFIEDGSYLRIKTMQIGYTLPNSLIEKIKVSSLRIYVNAQNLLTFTNYTGLDPEIGQGQQNPLDLGIDRAFYPQSRLFSLGFNLTF